METNTPLWLLGEILTLRDTEHVTTCLLDNSVMILIVNINVKNCNLYTVLTATDQKPQKS